MIGLGAMGAGMATRLIQQGFPLVAFDVDPDKNDQVAKQGAHIAECPADVARSASRVICMVDTSSQVEEVVLGPAGLKSRARSGDVLLCMSTVELAAILACHAGLADIGAELIDAPVSGGPGAAESGKLVVYAGATDAGMHTSRPILDAIADAVFHMGSLGSGFAAKMVNNILFHVGSVAVIEAMILGTKAGLDPGKMIDVLSRSTGDSVALRARAPRFLSRDFTGVPLRIAYREMVMETDFGRAQQVPLLLASVAEQVHAMGMARGLGEEEGSALVKVYEEIVGVQLAHR